MLGERLYLTASELKSESSDRFHRLRMIGWWNQERLRQAKALVIGAGALGNEVVKNLALLGWGNLLIADMDRIENSNLSRSILYREEDSGKSKAATAAHAARSIYPNIRVQPFEGNVVHDLGLGAFRWADIVVGGLDNREARLAINRNCWKLNRPWIDGAIEQIQGCARFFVPDGPCYECTMSDRDWKALQLRRSCNLLTQTEMLQGKTPTTPTISSIIAGVQCQEAVKHMHGLPTIQGRGWIFEGISGDSYLIDYQRKAECYSHEMLDEIVSLPLRANQTSVAQIRAEARRLLGDRAQLEMTRDVLEKFVCPQCGREERVFASLGRVSASRAICPNCPGVRRQVVTFYQMTEDRALEDCSLREVGVPPFDILVARAGERAIGLELSGDAEDVLGPLVGDEESVEWA